MRVDIKKSATPGTWGEGDIYNQSLSQRDFNEIRKFMESRCGIRIPPIKKQMVEGRLRKRLKALNIPSYHQYCDYVFRTEEGRDEIINMIDVITTNKTEFFRENSHFEFLAQKAVPELIDRHGAGIKRPLKVLSAGCSTGEEPYSIAMTLAELGRNLRTSFLFSILATDISTQVLKKAATAIYEGERVDSIPTDLLHKYFMRSKDPGKDLFRIVPELRRSVQFRRLNFMDEDYKIRGKMDIIFCRNVIIYFAKDTQEKVLRRLLNCLIPGGYLFLGHSETIHGMNLPVQPVAPTVYQKIGISMR